MATTFSFTTLVLSNIFVVYVLESSELAIKNMVASFKDKVIFLINLIILIMLFLIIYLPFLNGIVGTCRLSVFYLIMACFLAVISTFSFDILKKIKK